MYFHIFRRIRYRQSKHNEHGRVCAIPTLTTKSALPQARCLPQLRKRSKNTLQILLNRTTTMPNTTYAVLSFRIHPKS